jgi:serine-type D-Ala-D-Ala carboxypeptidase (penicillin-binding protein 5/6)
MFIPKVKITLGIIILTLSVPTSVFALQIPLNGSVLAEMAGVNAQSYVVQDLATGQQLIAKNADTPWPPASLTKLVTALVVLDTKPKLTKAVAMTSGDQTAGWCNAGGVCIKTKAGVKFTVDGLLHAALMPSANNAANALARSTGLSMDKFVERMNQKAKSLGATNSHFNEPTGMDPANVITANDYVKILKAAFDNPYLQKVAGQQTYLLRSVNNSKYNQTIKNNDKLLSDADVVMVGAKTGYLNESLYNFASVLKTDGQKLAVVVLGEQHLYTAFAETKLLASLAKDARALAFLNFNQIVLGTSTVSGIAN